MGEAARIAAAALGPLPPLAIAIEVTDAYTVGLAALGGFVLACPS